jgi:membrane-bound serine protease (ClpP class)
VLVVVAAKVVQPMRRQDHAIRNDSGGSGLGTVPIFVRRRWDSPLPRAAVLAWLGVWLCCPELLRSAEESPAKYSRPVLIEFDGEIMPWLESYVYAKLRAAKQQGADLVIIEIDSPGGLVGPSLSIAARLRDLDWAHTVAYIPEQALSGASFVALGCDDIIMGPNAKLGDAGVIEPNARFQFQYVPEKIRTHLAAEARDLAEAKGRPPALAEAMVDKDLVVYHVKNRKTGKETYMSQKEIESSPDPGQWEKINPVQETLGGNFLEVNGTRAVQLGLAQGITQSREELQRRYGLRGELPVYRYTGVDTAVYILNSPWVTGLLFVVGLVALYVELSAPGIGLGGLIAGLCFAIFFWSRFLGGTADLLDVILFVAGVAFLLVELFVLPGFGVAGLTGILLILGSLILASQTFVIPHTPEQWHQLNRTLLVILVSGVVVAVAAYLLSRHFGSLPLLSRLVLAPPQSDGGKAEASPVGGDRGAVQVGSCGVALSTLRPAGKARFGNQYVDVVTEGDFITKGSRVKVLEIRGNRVVVSEVDSEG